MKEAPTSLMIRRLVDHFENSVVAEHRLDEVEGQILEPKKRTEIRRDIAYDLVENRNFGLGKHIFVREFPRMEGETSIGVAMGLTEETAEGLKWNNATQHELIFQVKSKDWVHLSQKERQEKLTTEVLPRAKYFVVFLHGWDGEQGWAEPYGAMIMSPLSFEDTQSVDVLTQVATDPGLEYQASQGYENKTADLINLASDLRVLPEEIVGISLSYMGSLYGKKKEEVPRLNHDKVETQILEALDKIGSEIMDAKMKYFESEEYLRIKRNLVKEIQFHHLNNHDPDLRDGEQRQRVSALGGMVDEEEMVANGRYFDLRITNFIGHSMGGNVAQSIYRKAVLGRPMGVVYLHYRDVAKKGEKVRHERWRERIDWLNANLFSDEDTALPYFLKEDEVAWDYKFRRNGGIKNQPFFDGFRRIIRENAALTPSWEIESSDLGGRLEVMNAITLMQVVFGQKVENLPEWAKRARNEIEKHPVPLSNDVLIQLSNLLSGQLRDIELSTGDTFGIVDHLIRKYVGHGLPDSDQVYEMYKSGFKEDGNFVKGCAIWLSRMAPVISDRDLNQMTTEELMRFYGFAGDNDATVLNEYEMAMGKEMGQNHDSVRGYNSVHQLKDTGHHPQEKDMTLIKAKIFAQILMAKGKLQERQKAINNAVISWLQEGLAT